MSRHLMVGRAASGTCARKADSKAAAFNDVPPNLVEKGGTQPEIQEIHEKHMKYNVKYNVKYI